MVKCPECEKELDSLTHDYAIWHTATLYLDGESPAKASPDLDQEEFLCPECYQVIARCKEDALKFLAGE
jgi:ssDNA-binding Zn-finger/Zn-ribbon topoisomerase 1